MKRQWISRLLLILLSATVCAAAAQDRLPVPPSAAVIPREFRMHGETIRDDYFWLREKENPRVIDYIKAENRYAEQMMEHTAALRENLFREMRSRITETDLSVPVKIGDYYYYSRMEEGREYAVNCRKKGSLDAPEEVILDENDLAEGHEFFSLGVFDVSPDNKLLMYSVDTTGAESYTLYFKNLKTGRLAGETIPGTDTTAEWANDNATIYYVTMDSIRRPCRLYRHRVGTPAADDVLLYEETDEAFSLFMGKTRNERYLVMSLWSNTTSEIRVCDADTPEAAFRLVHRRENGVECSLYHHGHRFFLLTNKDAGNFKLMETPADAPADENWREVIPHRPDVTIEDIDVFARHLVVYERSGGLKKIRIRNLATGAEHYVRFPEPDYTFWTHGNRDFNAAWLRFSYSSFLTPETVYDYHMDLRRKVVKKRQEVPGYDPADYTVERISAVSHDGTRVPISMVYPAGLKRDGSHPCFLESYGAYGDSCESYFFTTCLALLNRGFIYAIPHIRGGSEMGREWYEDGKLLNKKNTFLDFIACAEHLIDRGYTGADRMIIRGESAGGLLMGAVTNMRPDLFEVVIAKVPFVDAVNTMLDASLPLTVGEYEEWGNPNIKKYFDYIRSYSPYDNVTAQRYPNMLVLTSLNDTRVMYWEPAKWVAKLRATKTDDNVLLFKTTMVAGHGGASGRYSYLRDTAFEYAFVFDRLSITE